MIEKNHKLEEIVAGMTSLCNPKIIGPIAISSVSDIAYSDMIVKMRIESRGVNEILTLIVTDKRHGKIDEQEFCLNQFIFLDSHNKNKDIGNALNDYLSVFLN